MKYENSIFVCLLFVLILFRTVLKIRLLGINIFPSSEQNKFLCHMCDNHSRAKVLYKL